MLQTHFTAPKMRTPRCLVGASHAVLSHTGFAAFAEVAATSLVGYFTVHHGAYSTLPIAHGLCVPTHKPSVLRKYLAWPVSSRTQNRSSPYNGCRELTLVAASGSERPLTANPVGDRVDFDTKGFWVHLVVSEDCLTRQSFDPIGHRCAQNPPVWPFRLNQLRSWRVTERYPPYSRLALERVPTAVGGEAEAEYCHE